MVNAPGNGDSAPLFIGVAEAAGIMRVSPRRLRAMIAAGLIPAAKVGKVWILDRAEVTQYVRRQQGRPRNNRNR